MAIQKRCFLNAIRMSKEQAARKERAEEALETETNEEQSETPRIDPTGAIAESSNLATKAGEVDILAEPESAEGPEKEPADSTEEEKTNFEAEDDDVDILVATEPAEEQTKKQAITVEADESEIDTEYEEVDILAVLEAASKREDLPDNDEHLIQVNKLPLGVWMEFQADGEQTIRCTLSAKISTIDKYIFVNSDGVKVVDKSRMGLAKELKAGSVKIISESPLVDRAMESVIGTLREGEAESTEEESLSLEPK